MDNKIIIEVKSNYGNEAIYILSDHKDSINSLTGKKTISKRDIKELKNLGFTFELKQNAFNF